MAVLGVGRSVIGIAVWGLAGVWRLLEFQEVMALGRWVLGESCRSLCVLGVGPLIDGRSRSCYVVMTSINLERVNVILSFECYISTRCVSSSFVVATGLVDTAMWVRWTD